MSDAAAIPASYVKLSTLVDGTVRVVIDVPREYLAQASAIFDKPGVPVALARLEPAKSETVSDLPEAQNDRTGAFAALRASQQSGILCGEPRFRRFLTEKLQGPKGPLLSGEEAAEAVREFCNVVSRSDLDRNEGAARAWRKLEANYRAWLSEPAFNG